jgi:hypothetical protein
MRALTILAAALPTMTACVYQPATAAYTDEPAPVAEPPVERQLTIAEADEALAPTHPLPAARVAPDPIRFQVGAGYGALSHVDLAGCREYGLQSGYVRVRATFTRVGYVVRAAVTSLTAPPPAALDCIADQLRRTGVPAFDGEDAKLSKTYFVGPE